MWVFDDDAFHCIIAPLPGNKQMTKDRNMIYGCIEIHIFAIDVE